MRPTGTGVLYITHDGLQLFVSSLPHIFAYQFNKESVDNLTVVNQHLLENDIAHFVVDNELYPANLVMIVADNASMIKQGGPEEVPQQNTKAGFVSKTISTENGTFLYIVNEQLCKSIKTAFEKLHFPIDFVLPALVFGNEFSNKDKLSVEDIETVLKHAFDQEQYNLIPTKMVPDEEAMDEIMEEATNKDIMRMYAAASIFGALIIAITVVWNINNPGPTQTYNGRAEKNQPAVLMPSDQETKALRVQIISGPNSSMIAQALEQSLSQFQFKSITLHQLETAQSQAIIRFNNQASPTVRGAVIAQVQQHIKNVVIEEKADTVFAITIILP